MICNEVRSALESGEVCEETDRGARVKTHCLYPSFKQVEVFVVKVGNGYLVTDGSGAVASTFSAGRDDIQWALAKAASRFGVEDTPELVQAKVPNADWLRSAILGVANASAYAARLVIEKAVEAFEEELTEVIANEIGRILPKGSYVSGGRYTGVSGKTRKYDFVARQGSDTILINGVTPHPASIASKYVAFADLPANDTHVHKLAVYNRSLEAHDAALISQVTDFLTPVDSLEGAIFRLAKTR